MTAAPVTWVGILIIITGLLVGQAVIVISGMLLSTIGGLSWLWASHLLGSVSLSLSLDSKRARPGDLVGGRLTLENDQPFPVPWLECRIEWPEELPVDSGDLAAHHRLRRQTLTYVLSLRWFERVARKFGITCSRRGDHVFGPAEMVVADPFGFFEGRKTVGATERLIVYPRVFPLVPPRPETKSPFGDRARLSWLFDDPIHYRGSREYLPTDPFSRIDWKASARTGILHTRLQDASYAPEVALVLDVATVGQSWEGIRRDVLERAIEVAASLITAFHRDGYRFALYTNGFVRGSRGLAMARMGSGAGQFRACMDVLARLLPLPATRCERILDLAAGQVGDRARLTVISALHSPALRQAASRQRSRGRSISVVLTEADAVPERSRVPAYLASLTGGGAGEAITFHPTGG